MTHTFARLEVSKRTYDEIRRKLKMANYGDQFINDTEYGILLDMHGIALQCEQKKKVVNKGEQMTFRQLNRSKGRNSEKEREEWLRTSL